MKLNWFSPLPPARSEIANHSARLLPALAARFDVVLWTDQERWHADLERHAVVRRYDPERMPWDELNSGAVSVYNIGNCSDFHAAIWKVSSRQPGLVILHDTSLQHLFADVFDKAGSLEEYRLQMAKYYGIFGRAAGNCLFRGEISILHAAKSFPLTELALEKALGAVVHNRVAFESLRRQERWPVVYAPLPYPAGAEPTPSTWPALPRAAAPLRLIVFGFIGPNRRLEAVLNALAAFPSREVFRLDVYGTVADVEQVQKLIRSLNLTGQVTLHGYVSDQELETALASAHMAFNLRYPTMGEASASQLRIWANALPSAVSQVDWYATQPADTVHFIRPDHEAEDLAALLQSLLTNAGELRALGAKGRRHLEQLHSLEAYVKSLELLVDRRAELRRRWVAGQLTERAAAAFSPWSYPGPLVGAFRRVAEQLERLTNAA
jgi:glycosyltransferase involved in cell wall biosynthesis